jgi:hypothetical protein
VSIDIIQILISLRELLVIKSYALIDIYLARSVSSARAMSSDATLADCGTRALKKPFFKRVAKVTRLPYASIPEGNCCFEGYPMSSTILLYLQPETEQTYNVSGHKHSDWRTPSLGDKSEPKHPLKRAHVHPIGSHGSRAGGRELRPTSAGIRVTDQAGR